MKPFLISDQHGCAHRSSQGNGSDSSVQFWKQTENSNSTRTKKVCCFFQTRNTQNSELKHPVNNSSGLNQDALGQTAVLQPCVTCKVPRGGGGRPSPWQTTAFPSNSSRMLPPHGSSTQRHQRCPHTSLPLCADAQTARPWLLRSDSVRPGVMPRMSNSVLIGASATLRLPLVRWQGVGGPESRPAAIAHCQPSSSPPWNPCRASHLFGLGTWSLLDPLLGCE